MGGSRDEMVVKWRDKTNFICIIEVTINDSGMSGR